MSKLVVLTFGNGDFDQGFSTVTALLWKDNTSKPQKFTGSLPPVPSIPEIYKRWKFLYTALADSLRGISTVAVIMAFFLLVKSGLQKIALLLLLHHYYSKHRFRMEISLTEETNFSKVDLDILNQQLAAEIKKWLEESPSFSEIRNLLRTSLSQTDEIRFIIDSDKELLQKLPWHLWSFFTDYPQAEVALSAPEWKEQVALQNLTNQVKILAILGNTQGINVEEDRKFLEGLPNAAVTFLEKPKRQDINNRLWEQNWDILFFAGHSQTIEETGKIYINETESLTIEQLKFSLQKAIEKGLQIAIFNSCDGLGLANQLANLHIPQVVVMREPVPDFIAQQFLKNFLQEFIDGKSLYTAVRESRKRLQGLENEFPCASWLPIICQNPIVIPPTWEQLRSGEDKIYIPEINKQPIISISVLFFSILATVFILGIRQIGILQKAELRAYDQMVRLRPDEKPDPRIMVITIDEKDLEYQDMMGMKRKEYEEEGKIKKTSLSDQALFQVLLRLQPHQPRVIGLDIYKDFPLEFNIRELTKQFQENNRFFAICKHNEAAQDNGIKPPDGVPNERLGFSDVVVDADGVIRRHLFNMNSNLDSPCPTEWSLSLQLAIRYLHTQGLQIAPKMTEEQDLQIGNFISKATLKTLDGSSGGYKVIDARGYQMLLNYRSRQIAQEVPLREILDSQSDSNWSSWVKDRIVIIGVTAPSTKDVKGTPYGVPMRGVFIQAQMASQIISAVLDKRPLIWVLPGWGDAILIGVWSVVGAVIAWRWRRIIYLSLGIGGSIIIISAGYFLLFWLTGCWLPFVPSVLVVICANGGVLGYVKWQEQLQQPNS